MFPADVLSPRRRTALLAALAVVLLATPLWAPTDDLGDETYTYERAQVVVDDEDGIAYANDPTVGRVGPISDDLGCSTGLGVRTCAFERLIVENGTVPTGVHSTTAGETDLPSFDRYQYVQIDGDVYATRYVANESVTDARGLYRVDLALEPVSASDALERVSVDPDSEYDDVPDAVAEAAREGSATTHRDVDVPRTPIRVDDGYYRVYQNGDSPPDVGKQRLGVLIRWGGVISGLLLVVRLARRFEVSYVGDER